MYVFINQLRCTLNIQNYLSIKEQEEDQNCLKIKRILIGPLFTFLLTSVFFSKTESALIPDGGERSDGGGKDRICENCEEGGSSREGWWRGPVGSRDGVHTIDHVLTRRRTWVRAELRLPVELIDAWERLQLGRVGKNELRQRGAPRTWRTSPSAMSSKPTSSIKIS